MFGFVNDHLDMVERSPTLVDRPSALAALRPLGLSDFADVLWQAPLDGYPRLSAQLPPMTPAAVQRKWTGHSGPALLAQSLSFVRAVVSSYVAITGRSPTDARVLDYGCGYGRFLRLFSYYSDQVWGVDAWESSLEHSRAAGFGDRVSKIPVRPERLPFEEPFDLAIAFSVFTHLPSAIAISALAAIRKSLRPGGIACITIRPEEFWAHHLRGSSATSPANAQRFVAAHRNLGFAFLADGPRQDVPDGAFGTASFTLDWLAGNTPGWTIAGVDRSLSFPMQRYVFLRRD